MKFATIFLQIFRRFAPIFSLNKNIKTVYKKTKMLGAWVAPFLFLRFKSRKLQLFSGLFGGCTVVK